MNAPESAIEPISAPHQTIETRDARERFAVALFDALWISYRERVSYVRDYEKLVAEHKATFFNDHIAFRTLASQRPTSGIVSISRLFEALGYKTAGCYQFPDKHLSSLHFQHSNPRFPKLFISELKTWELSGPARKIIGRSTRQHRDPLKDEFLQRLHDLEEQTPDEVDRLLRKAVASLQRLPWGPPRKKDVEALNLESQFGAWVLVHGYNVNHFTALINSHGVESLDSLDKTVAALRDAKVPLKADIEGAPGSKLRQTATEAVMVDVPVRMGKRDATMPWTYAYFELAERNTIYDPESNQDVRFEGFLGPQATQLFEMTRVKTVEPESPEQPAANS